MKEAERWVIGVDSGGTFTDLVAIDDEGRIAVAKVPSTPGRPAAAVVAALDRSEVEDGVARLVHGTTVATNAVLQREGARLCLLTTAGFEDVPYIQRLNRPLAYSLKWSKPKPLVRRRRILGVRERVDASGQVVEPLAKEECDRIVATVRKLVEDEGVEAIAISLLFSYLNDAHERELEERLSKALPHIPISRSSRISPIWREYERASTVLADAFVRPLISDYLETLQADIESRGDFPLLVLKSNGGMGTAGSVSNAPITTLLSGLAGGAVGGAYFGAAVGEGRCVTFDMGGTSTDIALVEDGVVGQVGEYEIEWGLPVVTPVVDVHAIGAGGGSIARIDHGGLLRVGPESAGADPGPACYGTGGTAPTVTDANLVLGRLSADYFLGGEMRLDPRAAEAAVVRLGNELGLSIAATALAIVGIANENMANAIRLVTVERGVDPRDYVLVAFGGAGPMHACGVAEAIGVRRVVVPPNPGLCSAFGAAIAQLRVDRVRSLGTRSDQIDEDMLRRRFLSAELDASAELRQDGLRGPVGVKRSVSCRYYLQNYEHDVPVADLENGFLETIMSTFHDLHREFFGYSFENEPVELVHCKLSVFDAAGAKHTSYLLMEKDAQEAGTRDVVGVDGRPVTTRILRRGRLSPVRGPALIEEADSTLYLPENWRAESAAAGCLVLTLEGGTVE